MYQGEYLSSRYADHEQPSAHDTTSHTSETQSEFIQRDHVSSPSHHGTIATYPT